MPPSAVADGTASNRKVISRLLWLAGHPGVIAFPRLILMASFQSKAQAQVQGSDDDFV